MTSSMLIGRLLVGPPWTWHEQVGDPVTNLGGTPIPAPRQALRHEVVLATVAADGNSDTLADRLRIRRQLRGLLNNTPLKLQSYIYVIYSDDIDQNGWYVPDFGQLVDIDGAVGLASGVWKLEQAAWLMAGHKRTNREARNVWMKDLRTGLAWRDFLKFVYTTDFSVLPALPITTLPNGASGISNSVNGVAVQVISMPTGRDGGISQRAVGPLLITPTTANTINPDLTNISFERSDASMLASDVIIYDRRGQLTNPTTGPDTAWEEVYGPDHQWNWLTVGATADGPVLDNGLVRIRFSQNANFIGHAIDAWNGSAYVEQGKTEYSRSSAEGGTILSTWQSAGVMEYTPDHAVVKFVINATLVNDPYSRDRLYITLKRGEPNVRFELYTSPGSDGVASDPSITWISNVNAGVGDINASVTKIDSLGTGAWTPGVAGAGKIIATAGSGTGTGRSGQFPSGTIGLTDFVTSENWVALLRCLTSIAGISAFQTNFVILQKGANALVGIDPTYTFPLPGTDAAGFGMGINVNHAGYFSLQIGFVATQADQIMEAEGMTLGTGTTAVSDPAASGTGNNVTTSTRTTDANPHISRGAWPNSFSAKYRVFARVKASASTLHIYAKTGATTGATVTVAGAATPVYTWLDLGEIVANNTTLEIHCWATAAATVYVDRIEAVLVEDRTRVGAIYTGARDMAQAALIDSRQMGALVAR